MVLPPAWPAWDGLPEAWRCGGHWRSAPIVQQRTERLAARPACCLRCLVGLFFFAGFFLCRGGCTALFAGHAGLDYVAFGLGFTITRFPDLAINRSLQPFRALADRPLATPGLAIAQIGRAHV